MRNHLFLRGFRDTGKSRTVEIPSVLERLNDCHLQRLELSEALNVLNGLNVFKIRQQAKKFQSCLPGVAPMDAAR
jgi:hypothetical protein